MRQFVSGLVLAAGASTRMGRPKQLLPFGSATLLDHVLSRAKAAGALDEVVVVIGAAAVDVRRQVDFSGVKLVENAEFSEGCSSSYRTGIGALDPRAEAVTVLLGDQPGVESAVIDTVVDAWRHQPGEIALASYRGRHGHPMVFAQARFQQLAALQGDKAAWKIVDAHPEWLRSVPIDRLFPGDVNTWQEYEALRGRAE